MDRIYGLLQKFIANAALAGTTLRNMGPDGTVGLAREYLKTIDLAEIGNGGKAGYPALLDRHTKRLQGRLQGAEGKTWGVARKSLNLFFRDVVYNSHLRKRYGLAQIEAVLEIPLDSQVSDGLHDEPEGEELPIWRTVNGLKSEDSAEFQRVASEVAKRKKTERVHLDLEYWRKGRMTVAGLFKAVALQRRGPIRWGKPVPEHRPGVYVITKSPGNRVVYIGRTDSSLAKRIGQFYRQKLEAKSPHRGGQYILRSKKPKRVYWSPTANSRAAEAQMLAAFEEREGRLPLGNKVRGAQPEAVVLN